MTDTPDSPNTITLNPAGPLCAAGNIAVLAASGEVLFEGPETYLCRCGHSSTKPFCDGSHETAGFTDAGGIGKEPRPTEADGAVGRLTITLSDNGPLRLAGPYVIVAADGTRSALADKGALCRCGVSAVRPMCDGAHRDSGFTG